MRCGSVLCWEWHADSWAFVWVSPTLPSPEQASALTPHISLTLMDTCSLCAWQDVLLRKLDKNGNRHWVDTPRCPQNSTRKKTQTCTYMLKHTSTNLHFSRLMLFVLSWGALKRRVPDEVSSPLKLVMELDSLDHAWQRKAELEDNNENIVVIHTVQHHKTITWINCVLMT